MLIRQYNCVFAASCRIESKVIILKYGSDMNNALKYLRNRRFELEPDARNRFREGEAARVQCLRQDTERRGNGSRFFGIV